MMFGSLCQWRFVRRCVKAWSVMTLLCVSLLLAACSSGPPPRLYLLEAAASVEKTVDVDVSSLSRIGIGQIKVPGYAADSRIASRDVNNSVIQMDAQRWAEDPEDSLTRYLADRLHSQADATVLIEPWPRDYNPQSRIEVVFSTLLRESDGGASMSGQILLLSGDGRALLKSHPFYLRVAGRSTQVSEFFKAVGVGMDEVVRISIDSMLNQVPSS